MSKKHYEKAALIAQGFAPKARNVVMLAFIGLFSGDNPRFDQDRFIRACVPGANVRARS